jgi:hypothetical protein
LSHGLLPKALSRRPTTNSVPIRCSTRAHALTASTTTPPRSTRRESRRRNTKECEWGRTLSPAIGDLVPEPVHGQRHGEPYYSSPSPSSSSSSSSAGGVRAGRTGDEEEEGEHAVRRPNAVPLNATHHPTGVSHPRSCIGGAEGGAEGGGCIVRRSRRAGAPRG